MAAQKGRDVLIKVGDGGDPSETFTTVAGIRSARLAFNAEVVDVSDQLTVGRWRTLLGAAGAKSMELSGSGVFLDNATDATLQGNAFDQTVDNYQLVMPGFGTFTGPFQITALEYTGDMNDAAQFSITLTSAGAIAFAAV